MERRFASEAVSRSDPGTKTGEPAERYPELFKLFAQPPRPHLFGPIVAPQSEVVVFSRKRGRPRKIVPPNTPLPRSQDPSPFPTKRTLESKTHVYAERSGRVRIAIRIRGQHSTSTVQLCASNQRVPGFNPAKKHDPHLNAAEIRFESRSNKPDFHGQSSRCALAYDTGDEESGIDVASHSNSFETRTDRSSPAPQSGKGSPRSIIAAHATLLRALSAYTVMRAHIPRELREIVRKKPPCTADMLRVLEYQEQMNILLRSEYYFLQRIEREYGSLRDYPNQHSCSHSFGYSNTGLPWETDCLTDLDSLIEAANRSTGMHSAPSELDTSLATLEEFLIPNAARSPFW